jgi:hypothetical protein
VLASGSAKGVRDHPRLWLFPVSGAKVTALTPQREGHGPDYGDIAAWRLSEGLFLQAEGPYGSEFIAQQWRNLTVHPITVPGTANNNRIITGLGAGLLVQAENGCPCGNSLLWFDPAISAVKYLLHAPATIEGVMAAVPFGRPSTS